MQHSSQWNIPEALYKPILQFTGFCYVSYTQSQVFFFYIYILLLQVMIFPGFLLKIDTNTEFYHISFWFFSNKGLSSL